MCAMDKYGSVDQNCYSPESQKIEREKAIEALNAMKEQEQLCKKIRTVIIERTQYGGIRKRYVKMMS